MYTDKKNLSTVINSNSLFALQAFFSFPRFFVPIVDGGVLPEAPEALMAAGNFNKDVSVISGTVKDEGAFFYRYHQEVIFLLYQFLPFFRVL